MPKNVTLRNLNNHLWNILQLDNIWLFERVEFVPFKTRCSVKLFEVCNYKCLLFSAGEDGAIIQYNIPYFKSHNCMLVAAIKKGRSYDESCKFKQGFSYIW